MTHFAIWMAMMLFATVLRFGFIRTNHQGFNNSHTPKEYFKQTILIMFCFVIVSNVPANMNLFLTFVYYIALVMGYCKSGSFFVMNTLILLKQVTKSKRTTKQ